LCAPLQESKLNVLEQVIRAILIIKSTSNEEYYLKKYCALDLELPIISYLVALEKCHSSGDHFPSKVHRSTVLSYHIRNLSKIGKIIRRKVSTSSTVKEDVQIPALIEVLSFTIFSQPYPASSVDAPARVV
jgi:hypothetical protein